MKYLEYKENMTHGTFVFPFALYHVTPFHPRYEMSYHWHMECEIIRILQGELQLTINNTTHKALEGDIIYLHEGMLHGAIPTDCIYECLVFDLSFLFSTFKANFSEIAQIINHSIIIQNHFPKNATSIHKLVWNIFDIIKEKSLGYEMILIGYLYCFYGTVIKKGYYHLASLLSSENNTRILQLKSVFELIETSYQEPISLEQLAKKANMNQKYFCRFFHEMTHKTPIEYLNYYRIEQACFLLITTSLSVTEIALSCGFNDVSYFIRTFKKFKNITPKKYLKQELIC